MVQAQEDHGSEGWTVEEVDAMREAIKTLCTDFTADTASPDCYIGVCMEDFDFKEAVVEAFESRFGRAPEFDVTDLRALVYAAQLDYGKDQLIEILFRFVDTGVMSPQSRSAALSLMPDENAIGIIEKATLTFKMLDGFRSEIAGKLQCN